MKTLIFAGSFAEYLNCISEHDLDWSDCSYIHSIDRIQGHDSKSASKLILYGKYFLNKHCDAILQYAKQHGIPLSKGENNDQERDCKRENTNHI